MLQNIGRVWIWACLVAALGCGDGPPKQPSTPVRCENGVLDAGESDIDCGGAACDPCALGLSCFFNSDCESDICEGNVCVAVSACADGIMNGSETDIDCGGAVCTPCMDGKMCNFNPDCMHNFCDGGVCKPTPTCFDNEQNQDETDIDCGGSCSGCPVGEDCLIGSDCNSLICTDNICEAAPTCSDLMLNGTETDVDCGGLFCAACADGLDCLQSSDCQSAQCDANVCISCSDGIMNGDETDVDCGGSCDPCAAGEMCLIASDCESEVCSTMTCATPVCGDGVINQPSEKCDDGNTEDEDACSADCSTSFCVVGSGTYPTVQSALADAFCSSISIPSGVRFESVTIGRSVQISGASDGSTSWQPSVMGPVIEINSGQVTLEDLTITAGDNPASGGGVSLNAGVLTLRRCALVGNQSDVDGGGLFASGLGRVRLEDVSFENNITTGSGGGAMITAQDGSEFRSVAFINNSAGADGGGIAFSSVGLHTLANVTLGENDASGRGGGIFAEISQLRVDNTTITDNDAAQGGGIFSQQSGFLVSHSILFGNRAASIPDDCESAVLDVESLGDNVWGVTTNCSLTGSTAADLFGSDPMLGARSSVGSDTDYYPIFTGSVAEDLGSVCPTVDALTLATDQLGQPRDDGACDAGAFEFQEP